MNRRGFIAAASGAVLATQLGRLSLAPEARANLTVLFGTSNTYNLDSNYYTYTSQIETKLSRKFAAVRVNGGFSNPAQAVAAINKSFDDGQRWAYMNGKPHPSNNVWTNYWKNVAAGVYDAAFHTLFNAIKADTRFTQTRPLYYSFHHEQYVKSEGGGIECGTAADFIAAFRHVRSLLNPYHTSNSGNMQMCFSPHWLQFAGDPVVGWKKPSSAVAPFVVSKLDPGSSYYDLLGADIYCASGKTYTPTQQWAPVHSWAVHQGKQFFTGEQGVDGTDTFVVNYLKQLDMLLKSYNNVVALNFTDRVAAGGDYRFDKTSTRFAQYKTMANDPFYGAVV